MAVFESQRDGEAAEAREARIAELRARRRKRLRWLAWRSGIAVGVLGLLAVGLAYWLLTTLGGRDFLLAQIQARLPAGTVFEWRAAEGPASGPLTLYDVRFVYQACPDRDEEPVPFGDCDEPLTLSFEAARVMLDPDIRPLFGRRLRLDALEVDDARLLLPPGSDEPFELPTWPGSLPQIGPLPLALQADRIDIRDFEVIGAEGPLIDVRSASGALDASNGALRVDNLLVDSDRGAFRVHGHYLPDQDYRMDLVASALLPAPAGRTRPRLGLVARGDVNDLAIAVRGHAPAPLAIDLTLRGGERRAGGWAWMPRRSTLPCWRAARPAPRRCACCWRRMASAARPTCKVGSAMASWRRSSTRRRCNSRTRCWNCARCGWTRWMAASACAAAPTSRTASGHRGSSRCRRATCSGAAVPTRPPARCRPR
nr:hypothetical protein [Luteimonas yindakuii]